MLGAQSTPSDQFSGKAFQWFLSILSPPHGDYYSSVCCTLQCPTGMLIQGHTAYLWHYKNVSANATHLPPFIWKAECVGSSLMLATVIIIFYFTSTQCWGFWVFSFRQHPIDFVCGWRFAQLGAARRFEPALQELINAAFIPGVQGAQQTAELHLTYRTRWVLQHLPQRLVSGCRFAKNHCAHELGCSGKNCWRHWPPSHALSPAVPSLPCPGKGHAAFLMLSLPG